MTLSARRSGLALWHWAFLQDYLHQILVRAYRVSKDCQKLNIATDIFSAADSLLTSYQTRGATALHVRGRIKNMRKYPQFRMHIKTRSRLRDCHA